MDRAKGYVKDFVQKCWDNNIEPIITTLLPRRDINSNGVILFDYFNDWIKDYANEQSALGRNISYIDFFNAGKDFDPPEPLGDPKDPYKLNPLFDGDNIFDENGNQIRSGLGVHLNPEGYRVMGYAVPLSLFKSADSGFKLYSDSEAKFEEKLNTDDVSNPHYELNVNNIRRGTPKEIIRYVKNVGISPTLYYIYINDIHNVKYYFIDDNGNKSENLFGLANPNIIKKIRLVVESEYDDFNSDFKLHIITRDLTSQSQ